MWKASSVLMGCVLVLLVLGIVMLSSTSSAKADDTFKDPYYFLRRQLVWLTLAIAAGCFSAAVIDYHWLGHRLTVITLALVSFTALVMVFVPGIGCEVGGAARWVKLGSLRIGQPSELAKFSMLVALASWMTYAGHRAHRLKEGLLIPLSFLSVALLLILAEPDYGTTLLLGAVGLAVMFAGGARFSHVLVVGAAGACGFVLVIMQNAERMRRFFAFIRPDTFPDEAYQLRQSVYSFILGGGLGVGLGKSLQKHSYLPEAHTDFILAIIGEELGVGATLTVILLFVAFLVCGMIISISSKDNFGRLLGFGLTTMISLQAAINIGVVTGCLPTKGLPLPFISAGGSSLVMSVFSVGVLVNIARHASGDVVDTHTQKIKNRMGWMP